MPTRSISIWILFWRRDILPFLREFKTVFQLSGPHPKPIRKRQTCRLWRVGSFILLLLCGVSQSPLRTRVVELLGTREAGFLTSSIICKPVIDLSWLQVHIPSQFLLQIQVQGGIGEKKNKPYLKAFPFSSKSSPAKELSNPEPFIH